LNAEPDDILELDPLVRVAKRRGVENFPVVAVDHAKKELELVDRDKWQVLQFLTMICLFALLKHLNSHCDSVVS
jgi:hypothetical protein